MFFLLAMLLMVLRTCYEKTCLQGISARSDLKRAVQSRKMARHPKILIKKVESYVEKQRRSSTMLFSLILFAFLVLSTQTSVFLITQLI